VTQLQSLSAVRIWGRKAKTVADLFDRIAVGVDLEFVSPSRVKRGRRNVTGQWVHRQD
jgi:hypothetical protein